MIRTLANQFMPRPLVRRLRKIWRGVIGTSGAAEASLADLSGEGDWKAAGYAIVLWAEALCHAERDANVLDIGCGPGRMAEGLLDWLNTSGSYTGFDPSAEAIRVAESRLGSDPRARFFHTDLANGEYNPGGREAAQSYCFPCENATIDLAIATSVFTHMKADATAHYIAETARCLKPGGAFLMTLFLLDTESRAAMATGKAAYRFRHRLNADSATIDRKTPERAIAVTRDFIVAQLSAAGLEIEEKIHAGTWRGLDHAMAFQDLIVARKPG